MPRKKKRDKISGKAAEVLDRELPRGARYIVVAFDGAGYTLVSNSKDEQLIDGVKQVLWELLPDRAEHVL